MSEAADAASALIDAVLDDPERRVELAGRFYADRPAMPSVRGYRRAELAFMGWQVRRGVLAPLDAVRPGSAWWRAVNAGLLRDQCEADLLRSAPAVPSRPSVARWTEFLGDPSPAAWYRAHNASIVAGYLAHRPLTELEVPAERFFLDVTLGRVLFAQVLVLDPRLAVGRWAAPLARLSADPRWRGVDAYLSLRRVLPDDYPISGLTITEILDAENVMGRLLDYGVMLPKVQALYERAAEDLQEPRLVDLVRDGRLVYAWPDEEGIVWDRRRNLRLSGLLERVTSPALRRPPRC
jgi:hypothetical protein